MQLAFWINAFNFIKFDSNWNDVPTDKEGFVEEIIVHFLSTNNQKLPSVFGTISNNIWLNCVSLSNTIQIPQTFWEFFVTVAP